MPKPLDLPEERPRLPGTVYRELRAATRPDVTDDVVRAYGAAGEALADGQVDDAVRLLRWAKEVASRSAAVREALGVALYHAEDYAGAHAELLAYRRLSGRADQNHLLADSARALGRENKVAAYVEEMRAAGGVPPDRVVEGLIVLAGHTADRGDARGALDVLARAGLRPDDIRPWHPRVWYLAAELAARLGDVEQQRGYLEAIAAVTGDYLDVAEQLAALGE